MKITLLIPGILSLALTPLLAESRHAHPASDFDEFLTFDDNLVPPDWAITFPYGGPGRNAHVVKGRFQIGQVDTYAALDKGKTLPADMTRVHINIECDVKNIYYGSGYQIHLLMNDGGDFVVGFGKEGDGTPLMNPSRAIITRSNSTRPTRLAMGLTLLMRSSKVVRSLSQPHRRERPRFRDRRRGSPRAGHHQVTTRAPFRHHDDWE